MAYLFQSYQGSIFTVRISDCKDVNIILAFNPIKVLFLRHRQNISMEHYLLSILSRFYFYAD